MPRTKPGERPGIIPALTQFAARIASLEKPRNPAWLYVTPVAPATEPDDYISGFTLYPAFNSPWVNTGGAYGATAFRLFEGRPQIRLFCTGGEATPDSVIFTLPVGFRPKAAATVDVICGANKLNRGTVEALVNGDVVWRGFAILNGGTP